MKREALRELEEVVGQLTEQEEELAQALSRCLAEEMIAAERTAEARAELDRCRQRLEQCDASGASEVGRGVTARDLSRREAFRHRLLEGRDRAEATTRAAREAEVEVAEARRALQRRLGEAAARRLAAEKMAEEAAAELDRRAEARGEEEIAELRAARTEEETW